jgi:Fe-S-cluster-containing hydrogenase component 2
MGLIFIKENCIGCKLCHLACSGTKEAVFNPRLARLSVTSYYINNQLNIVGNVCTICGSCVDICPSGAITLEENRLKFDIDTCTECGVCIDSCPEKVIFSRDKGIALCDLCKGSPACVKWCPHGALTLNVQVVTEEVG